MGKLRTKYKVLAWFIMVILVFAIGFFLGLGKGRVDIKSESKQLEGEVEVIHDEETLIPDPGGGVPDGNTGARDEWERRRLEGAGD